jgi:Tol biopolymer transport system component
VALLGYFALTARPVHATFPGTNGQIAFNQGDLFNNIPAFIFTDKPDGSDPDQLSLPVDVEFFSQPRWSPNGTLLLISHTFRLDSTGQCCLPFRPATVAPDGTNFNLLEIPDGPQDMDCATWLNQTRILCAFGENGTGVFSVRVSDGAVLGRLTSNPYGAEDLPTDVSPDSKRFLFIRFKPGPDPAPNPHPDRTQQVALFVENSDGTGLRQITPYGLAQAHDLAGAHWSPDGREIISATTQGNLFVVPVDGVGINMIHLQTGTTRYFAFEPGWSPDGTRIIFGIFINGGEGIYTANPDGSDVQQVEFTTDFSNLFNAPDWGKHPLQ